MTDHENSMTLVLMLRTCLRQANEDGIMTPGLCSPLQMPLSEHPLMGRRPVGLKSVSYSSRIGTRYWRRAGGEVCEEGRWQEGAGKVTRAQDNVDCQELQREDTRVEGEEAILERRQ